jgi:type II secretion system protein I
MTARGFTLLETLVAMTIVGLVSIGVLGAVAASGRASDRAALTLVASELAEERLAALSTLSAAALADSTDGRDFEFTVMPDWRWSASTVPRADSLVALAVTIRGRGITVERYLLRPAGSIR